MGKLSNMGRLLYGLAITGLGLVTIFDQSLPYMLVPPAYLSPPAFVTYLSGALLILAGLNISFSKKPAPIALLLAFILLGIFCFYFIPYGFSVKSDYLLEWENAAKELAIAGGALFISGRFTSPPREAHQRLGKKRMRYGAILFAIPILSFSLLHFLYTKEASTLVPSWVPAPVFWTYLAGLALLGAGLAILMKFRLGLVAGLLGTMIFIWVIILHAPRVLTATSADLGGEAASALIALAYSGTAFVIAGTNWENNSPVSINIDAFRADLGPKR